MPKKSDQSSSSAFSWINLLTEVVKYPIQNPMQVLTFFLILSPIPAVGKLTSFHEVKANIKKLAEGVFSYAEPGIPSLQSLSYEDFNKKMDMGEYEEVCSMIEAKMGDNPTENLLELEWWVITVARKPEKAVEVANKILQLNPYNEHALAALIHFNKLDNRNREIIKLGEKLDQLETLNSMLGLVARGFYRTIAGEDNRNLELYKKGLEDLQQAMVMEPEYPPYKINFDKAFNSEIYVSLLIDAALKQYTLSLESRQALKENKGGKFDKYLIALAKDNNCGLILVNNVQFSLGGYVFEDSKNLEPNQFLMMRQCDEMICVFNGTVNGNELKFGKRSGGTSSQIKLWENPTFLINNVAAILTHNGTIIADADELSRTFKMPLSSSFEKLVEENLYTLLALIFPIIAACFFCSGGDKSKKTNANDQEFMNNLNRYLDQKEKGEPGSSFKPGPSKSRKKSDKTGSNKQRFRFPSGPQSELVNPNDSQSIKPSPG